MKKLAINTMLWFLVFGLGSNIAFGFWVWTPKTKKFEYAKDAGKDTPKAQAEFAKGKKDPQEKLKEWKSLLSRFPKSPQAAEALYNIGRIYEDMHMYYTAHKYYKRLIKEYPFSEYLPQAIEREYKIGLRFLEGYKRKFWDITKPIENPALEIFDIVIASSPYSEYAPAALYYKGLYYKKKGLYEDAREAFESLLKTYSSSKWVDKAEYQIAMCYFEMSKDPSYDQEFTARAKNSLKKFLAKYPNSSFREKAEEMLRTLDEKEAAHFLKIAEFYLKQQRYKPARLYLDKILSQYPGTKAAEKARQLKESLDKK